MRKGRAGRGGRGGRGRQGGGSDRIDRCGDSISNSDNLLSSLPPFDRCVPHQQASADLSFTHSAAQQVSHTRPSTPAHSAAHQVSHTMPPTPAHSAAQQVSHTKPPTPAHSAAHQVSHARPPTPALSNCLLHTSCFTLGLPHRASYTGRPTQSPPSNILQQNM